MIKFDEKLLQGKSIDKLDERYFRIDNNDDIKLTEFAENKIVKAMQNFYSKKLKELSIAANNTEYVSKIELKKVKDDAATAEINEKYEKEYKHIYEEFDKMQEEYKASHPDEFDWVKIVDPGNYVDEDGNYKNAGGNLYNLTCTSIKEAAEGYATATMYLKDNDDTSSFPTVKQYKALDVTKWKLERENMKKKLLEKYPNIPDDLFVDAKATKEEYTCRINGAQTKKLTPNDEMLKDAANEYIRTMLDKE